jgi:hypothetical protein
VTGKHGETLGATDANIANGIPADKAVNNFMKAIYLRKSEYVLYNDLIQRLAVFLAPLSSWFDAFANKLDMKRQM